MTALTIAVQLDAIRNLFKPVTVYQLPLIADFGHLLIYI